MPETYPGSEGVTYRETEKIDRVWTADGFDFSGYDSIIVMEVKSEYKAEDEDEDEEDAEKLQATLKAIQRELAQFIELRKIVPKVLTDQAQLHTSNTTLKLETILLDFEKGSTASRIMWGGGRAHIKVRGRLSDVEANKPLIIIEDESSSQKMGSLEAGPTDAALQMAEDWTKFMSQVKNHEKIEFED